MAKKAEPDALTQATATAAWVILLNKPFYPLYVWRLVGSGVEAPPRADRRVIRPLKGCRNSQVVE